MYGHVYVFSMSVTIYHDVGCIPKVIVIDIHRFSFLFDRLRKKKRMDQRDGRSLSRLIRQTRRLATYDRPTTPNRYPYHISSA
jgi:hypothetical protein